jgi:hypothetical protein
MRTVSVRAVAGLVTGALALSLMSACQPDHGAEPPSPTGATGSASTTATVAPVEFDAMLLPLPITGPQASLDNASELAVELSEAAAQEGDAGLSALLTLLRDAGFAIVDGSQGKVVGGAAQPDFTIQPAEVLHLHDLMVESDQTPLAAIYASAHTMIAAKAEGGHYPQFAAAVQADITQAMASSIPTQRFWAAVMSNGWGDSGAALTGTAPVAASALQAVLLLKYLLSQATREIARAAPTTNQRTAFHAAQREGCSEEGMDELFVGFISKSMSFVTGKGLEMALEEAIEEAKEAGGTGKALSRVTAGMRVADALWPILQIILLKVYFHAEAHSDPPVLERTKGTSADGRTTTVSVRLTMATPDRSHVSGCLAAMLAVGFGQDLDLPKEGALRNIAVGWDIIEGGATGTDVGFVQFCGDCSNYKDILHAHTDDNGVTAEPLIALRQKHDMSRATQHVQRRAVLRISADPNDVQEEGEKVLRTLLDAASTATSAALNLPAAVTKVVARQFTDLGFLAVRVVQPVQDWAMLPKTVDVSFTGDGLQGAVQLIPYNGTEVDPEVSAYDYGPCRPAPDPQCYLTMDKNVRFTGGEDCAVMAAHLDAALTLEPETSSYSLSLWSKTSAGDSGCDGRAPAGQILHEMRGTYASDTVIGTGEATYGPVTVRMHFTF